MLLSSLARRPIVTAGRLALRRPSGFSSFGICFFYTKPSFFQELQKMYSAFRFKFSALKVDIPAYCAIHSAENPLIGWTI